MCLVILTSVLPLNVSADNEASDIAIWDGTIDTSWYDSEETELHISTAEELAGLAALVNSGRTMEGQIIYLDNDIYLNDITDYDNWENTPPENNWKSIGGDKEETQIFEGTFNAQNHSIFGMFYNLNNYYGGYIFIGLFSNNSGTIENVKLKNIYIPALESTSYNGKSCIGGICGENFGTISHCSTSGKIDTKLGYNYNDKSTYLGGIVGYSSVGNISECKSDINITVKSNSSKSYIGGICGFSVGGTIDKCVNTGNIDDFGYGHYTGGICGCLRKYEETVISNCYNKGDIKTYIIANYKEGGYVGGITGETNNGNIYNVYNTGIISGEWQNISGGIVSNNKYGENNIHNAYYLSGSAIKGVGYGEDNTISKKSENMQKESFIESLGEEFIYNEGDYPLLKWEVKLKGDINDDGIINVADLVLLQKYLLCIQKFSEEEWNIADMNNDGSTDIFDMVLLRKELIKTMNT